MAFVTSSGARRRRQIRSGDQARVPRARNARQQRWRPGGYAHRAPGPGSVRYRCGAGPEPSRLRLQAGSWHSVGRTNFGRQLISRADIASISGRDADRPFRERAREPHDPGFLRSEVLGEGRGCAALSPDDDLVADQPAHSWRAHQPQGQRRQCHAAHPARDVEHVHVPYPEEHAARRLLVSQSSARADDAACLLRPGGSARDRADRRQHSARHEAPYPDPEHGAPVQRCLRSRGGTGTDQQCELAAMGQHGQAAGRR